MKRHVWWTTLGLGLALGTCLVITSDSQSAAADEGAKAGILELAEGKGDPEALAKKADLGDFMHLFKPKAKKGLGVGPKGEGIEQKLMALGKRTDKADVSANAAAYEKMAQITLAIAKVTDAHAPKEKKAGQDPKKWKEYVAEMKAGATDLAAAAKEADAAKVKTAANKTITACNDCHAMFRDN
jgi:hypothetical protein